MNIESRVAAVNPANGFLAQIKLGLGLALLAILTGCVGYVDGGYGSGVVVPVPDVVVFGGPDYERGPVVRDYSRRGFESRAIAHPGGRR